MDSIRTILVGGSPLLQAGISAVLGQHRRVRLLDRIRDTEDLSSSNLVDCDVLILCSDVPRRDAGLVLEKITSARLPVKLLVLTENADGMEAVETLRLGVRGYGVSTALGSDELGDAVVALIRWGFWVCPRTLEYLLDLALDQKDALQGGDGPDSVLSHRELEVLRHLSRGAHEDDIAEALCLSRNTVKTYLRRIREKLHADSRHEALTLAIKRGLIPAAYPDHPAPALLPFERFPSVSAPPSLSPPNPRSSPSGLTQR